MRPNIKEISNKLLLFIVLLYMVILFYVYGLSFLDIFMYPVGTSHTLKDTAEALLYSILLIVIPIVMLYYCLYRNSNMDFTGIFGMNKTSDKSFYIFMWVLHIGFIVTAAFIWACELFFMYSLLQEAKSVFNGFINYTVLNMVVVAIYSLLDKILVKVDYK